MNLDRQSAYVLRAALISLLRLLEDGLRLAEEERALKPPRRWSKRVG
jgi:hypothetical protein